MKKIEKIFSIVLILLIVFTIGVQIGIKHGRNLERQDILNPWSSTNDY